MRMLDARCPVVAALWAATSTLLLSVPALADPGEITVDAGARFSRGQLCDAVSLRAPAGLGDQDIRVSPLGDGRLRIQVGDESQEIDLAAGSGRDRARVVAMVIVSMADGRAGNRPAPDPAAQPGLAARPARDDEVPDVLQVEAAPRPRRQTGAPSRWALRVGLLRDHEDGGYETNMLEIGGALSLSRYVRLVGTLDLGHNQDYLASQTTLLPLRLGIEGRAGGLGIELGVRRLWYEESSCGGAEWGSATGPYGAAQAYLPVSSHARVVLQLGGYRVGWGQQPTRCRSNWNYSSYGGWMSGGVEWSP